MYAECLGCCKISALLPYTPPKYIMRLGKVTATMLFDSDGQSARSAVERKEVAFLCSPNTAPIHSLVLRLLKNRKSVFVVHDYFYILPESRPTLYLKLGPSVYTWWQQSKFKLPSKDDLSVLRCPCTTVLSLQVVEAIVCIFQDDLSSKRVNAGVQNAEEFVAGDMQCRSCSSSNDATTVTDLQRELVQHHCMAESDTCRCGMRLRPGLWT